jgi:hypothetical protein
MTVASDSVTDSEFAALVKGFGEKQAASMVLLLAYANFQDRFLLCLGATVEPEGPLPPVDVVFDRTSFATRTTPPPPLLNSPLPKPTGKDLVEDDPRWGQVNYETLQERLETQRNKPTRLRIPSWDEVSGNLPEGLMNKPSDIVWYRICFGYAPELAVPFEIYLRTAGAEAAPKYDRIFGQRGRNPRLPVPSWDEVRKNLPPAIAARPTRIRWNLVCSGYLPELAIPWSMATRTMWAEAKPDRVFEESLFWVQTRSIRCNYCMGHCEMLLEVAGLGKDAIAERTRRLASDDWSCFPPAEQRAYAYARKLSKTPWELTAADYKTLQSDLGPDKAMATFWWLCRGLYMTRVSDGFQLPLERDNVFRDFYGPKPVDPSRAPAGKP